MTVVDDTEAWERFRVAMRHPVFPATLVGAAVRRLAWWEKITMRGIAAGTGLALIIIWWAGLLISPSLTGWPGFAATVAEVILLGAVTVGGGWMADRRKLLERTRDR